MITEAELHAQFVRLCEEKTPAAVAKKFKLSRSYVSEIVNKRRLISKNVAKQLGYKPLRKQPLERLFVECDKNSQKSA